MTIQLKEQLAREFCTGNDALNAFGGGEAMISTSNCNSVWIFRLLTILLLAVPISDYAKAGDFYALLVGVKQYDNKSFNSLKYTEDDVTELAIQLQNAGFNKDNIVLMTQTAGAEKIDLMPTKDRIGVQFKAILKELQPEDTFIVVFSGHGVQFRDDPSQYFCPADAKIDSKSSMVSILAMYSALSNPAACKAQYKVLIVDACRNEPFTASGKSAKGLDLGSIGADRKPPPRGLAAIYSCSKDEQSWEHPELKHGVFLYHVIQAFNGQGDLDKDGELSLQELTQYSVKNTQRFVRTNFNLAQTPELLVEGQAMMSLGKVSVAGSDVAPAGVGVQETGLTESFSEDFRLVPNVGLPDGWVSVPRPRGNSLGVRQDGRAHLRTYVTGYGNFTTTGSAGFPNLAAVRLPPLDLRGNFFIELSTLSNDVWTSNLGGKEIRSLVIELKNTEDENLVFRCFEDETGFIAVLPGSEESKPFSLSGKTPYKLRLERENGKYRFTINTSRVFLAHDAQDHRDFEICELELSPNVFVGSVKIGPLPDSPNRPASKSLTPARTTSN